MSKKIIDKNDLERRKNFGLGLKELLKQSNMTQKNLADKIDIHENAVSSWITGKSDITYTSLCRILEVEELNSVQAIRLLFQVSIRLEANREYRKKCEKKIAKLKKNYEQQIEELEDEIEQLNRKYLFQEQKNRPNESV